MKVHSFFIVLVVFLFQINAWPNNNVCNEFFNKNKLKTEAELKTITTNHHIEHREAEKKSRENVYESMRADLQKNPTTFAITPKKLYLKLFRMLFDILPTKTINKLSFYYELRRNNNSVSPLSLQTWQAIKDVSTVYTRFPHSFFRTVATIPASAGYTIALTQTLNVEPTGPIFLLALSLGYISVRYASKRLFINNTAIYASSKLQYFDDFNYLPFRNIAKRVNFKERFNNILNKQLDLQGWDLESHFLYKYHFLAKQSRAQNKKPDEHELIRIFQETQSNEAYFAYKKILQYVLRSNYLDSNGISVLSRLSYSRVAEEYNKTITEHIAGPQGVEFIDRLMQNKARDQYIIDALIEHVLVEAYINVNRVGYVGNHPSFYPALDAILKTEAVSRYINKQELKQWLAEYRKKNLSARGWELGDHAGTGMVMAGIMRNGSGNEGESYLLDTGHKHQKIHEIANDYLKTYKIFVLD